jgi:hypothetical protein
LIEIAVLQLSGPARDEVIYFMSTCPTIRRHDEDEHGDFRTGITICDICDRMAR